jgi:hypothetical protein
MGKSEWSLPICLGSHLTLLKWTLQGRDVEVAVLIRTSVSMLNQVSLGDSCCLPWTDCALSSGWFISSASFVACDDLNRLAWLKQSLHSYWGRGDPEMQVAKAYIIQREKGKNHTHSKQYDSKSSTKLSIYQTVFLDTLHQSRVIHRYSKLGTSGSVPTVSFFFFF